MADIYPHAICEGCIREYVDKRSLVGVRREGEWVYETPSVELLKAHSEHRTSSGYCPKHDGWLRELDTRISRMG